MNYRYPTILLLLLMVATPSFSNSSSEKTSECTLEEIENVAEIVSEDGLKIFLGIDLEIVDDAGNQNTRCKQIYREIQKLAEIVSNVVSAIASFSNGNSKETSVSTLEEIKNVAESIASKKNELKILLGINPDPILDIVQSADKKNTRCEEIYEEIKKLAKIVSNVVANGRLMENGDQTKFKEIVDAHAGSILAKLRELRTAVEKIDNTNTSSIIKKLKELRTAVKKIDNTNTSSIIKKLKELRTAVKKIDNTNTSSIIKKLKELRTAVKKIDNTNTSSIIKELKELRTAVENKNCYGHDYGSMLAIKFEALINAVDMGSDNVKSIHDELQKMKETFKGADADKDGHSSMLAIKLEALIDAVGMGNSTMKSILMELEKWPKAIRGADPDKNGYGPMLAAKLDALINAVGMGNSTMKSILVELKKWPKAIKGADADKNGYGPMLAATLDALIDAVGMGSATMKSILVELEKWSEAGRGADPDKNGYGSMLAATLDALIDTVGMGNSTMKSILVELEKWPEPDRGADPDKDGHEKLTVLINKVGDASIKSVLNKIDKVDAKGQMQNDFSNIHSILILLLTLLAVTSAIFGTLAAIEFPKEPEAIRMALSNLAPKLAWHLNARRVDESIWPLDSAFRLIYKGTIYKEEMIYIYKAMNNAIKKQEKNEYLDARLEWRDLRKSPATPMNDTLLNAAALYSEAYLLVQEYNKKDEEAANGSTKPTVQATMRDINNNYKHVTKAISLYEYCLSTLRQQSNVDKDSTSICSYYHLQAEVHLGLAKAYNRAKIDPQWLDAHKEDRAKAIAEYTNNALSNYRMAYVMDGSLVEARYAIIELEELARMAANNDKKTKADYFFAWL